MCVLNTSRGLAAKSPKKQCKYTRLRYALPLPLLGGIHRTIAYIKGIQAVNRPIFRWYILTPNKVTPNTRKLILNDILCHFRKQLQQRKSLDRSKLICSGLFFLFNLFQQSVLDQRVDSIKNIIQIIILWVVYKKLSALYHLFHIYRCHI